MYLQVHRPIEGMAFDSFEGVDIEDEIDVSNDVYQVYYIGYGMKNTHFLHRVKYLPLGPSVRIENTHDFHHFNGFT